ncbi:shikimate dehydrogenase [Brucella cytisi]|uniref:Shikimate dehydrogenase n=1 Tax=Brucella cytisi TaxID=407152 RepID=A0A1J6HP95_9HYPH|nr:shikimate dehydrogenase [Brucella cytisi]OIS94780.1 shikimate dehydrogenase [Brucella cytisi]
MISEVTKRRVHVGLIGANIQRSLSPAMHMREGEAIGLAYRYDIIDIAENERSASDLPVLVEEAEAAGFAGLNVTHPCKQAAVALVDELSLHARALQSINTVVFSNGRRIGHNTDWWGYAEGFRRGLPDASLERVVLLGAGGAGVAVAYALAEMGAREVHIFDLDAAKVDAVIDKLVSVQPQCSFVAGAGLEQTLAQASGLVHATPTGMDAHPGLPLAPQLVQPHLWVSDIVYFPLQTALVQLAKERGCHVLDGGGMAVFQAVGAFELFSGIKADPDRMLAHFAQLQARS